MCRLRLEGREVLVGELHKLLVLHPCASHDHALRAVQVVHERANRRLVDRVHAMLRAEERVSERLTAVSHIVQDLGEDHLGFGAELADLIPRGVPLDIELGGSERWAQYGVRNKLHRARCASGSVARLVHERFARGRGHDLPAERVNAGRDLLCGLVCCALLAQHQSCQGKKQQS
jgi:hypothetical protein